MVLLGKVFLVFFAVLASSSTGFLFSTHGLILHGIYIDTVSLNGSISSFASNGNTGRLDRAVVELRCDVDRMVVSRVKTDYLGRFDFYFKTIEVPKFNPFSCDVVAVCDAGGGGGGGLIKHQGLANIKEETIARTSDGAQAFFHATSFMWSST